MAVARSLLMRLYETPVAEQIPPLYEHYKITLQYLTELSGMETR